MPIPQKLLTWYDQNARVLPWRSFPSPYRVWISEIMLQQTRVDTVLPYFERFIARFPDIQSLAEAEQAEVFRLWEGLGYYSRARNLHKAAKVLLIEHNGEFPSTFKELESLPGVGRYTAAAIASIAFNQPVAAVDGNIKRIYARLLNYHGIYGSPVFGKTIAEFAQEILPPDRPGDFTQALMDLGSAICTPRQPNCPECPLHSDCLAAQIGTQDELPVKAKKAPIPHYDVCVAVIEENGKILLKKRPEKGLLAGLWEYPGGKVESSDESLEAALKREIEEKTGLTIRLEGKMGTYKHAYTHFKINVHAWQATIIKSAEIQLPPEFSWISIKDLAACPMGKVARRISNQIYLELIQAKNQ